MRTLALCALVMTAATAAAVDWEPYPHRGASSDGRAADAPIIHAGSTAVQAVRPRQIVHAPTCPRCEAQFTEVVRLIGSAAEPIGATGGFARDSRGRLYTTSEDRSQILVFAPNGQFMRAIGRRGSGPGEFGAGSEAVRVGARDSIHVFHSGRVTIFSPDYELVRTIQIPMPRFEGSREVLRDGRYMVGGRLPISTGVRHPFHLLASDGTIIRSFGGEDQVMNSVTATVSGRFILSSDQRSIWLMGPGYRLRQWSIDGVLVNDLEVTGTPWYEYRPPVMRQPPSRGGGPPTSSPPPSSIVGPGFIDDAGLLWINGAKPVGRGADGRWAGEFEMYTEVVDPIAGSIVLSQQSTFSPRRVAGSNLGWQCVETDSGDLTCNVLSAEIVR